MRSLPNGSERLGFQSRLSKLKRSGSHPRGVRLFTCQRAIKHSLIKTFVSIIVFSPFASAYKGGQILLTFFLLSTPIEKVFLNLLKHWVNLKPQHIDDLTSFIPLEGIKPRRITLITSLILQGVWCNRRIDCQSQQDDPDATPSSNLDEEGRVLQRSACASIAWEKNCLKNELPVVTCQLPVKTQFFTGNCPANNWQLNLIESIPSPCQKSV